MSVVKKLADTPTRIRAMRASILRKLGRHIFYSNGRYHQQSEDPVQNTPATGMEFWVVISPQRLSSSKYFANYNNGSLYKNCSVGLEKLSQNDFFTPFAWYAWGLGLGHYTYYHEETVRPGEICLLGLRFMDGGDIEMVFDATTIEKRNFSDYGDFKFNETFDNDSYVVVSMHWCVNEAHSEAIFPNGNLGKTQLLKLSAGAVCIFKGKYEARSSETKYIVYRMASQTSEFFPYESEMKEIVVLVRIFASFYILTASCTDEVFTKDAAVSGKGIELVPEFNENFLVEHAQFDCGSSSY